MMCYHEFKAGWDLKTTSRCSAPALGNTEGRKKSVYPGCPHVAGERVHDVCGIINPSCTRKGTAIIYRVNQITGLAGGTTHLLQRLKFPRSF